MLVCIWAAPLALIGSTPLTVHPYLSPLFEPFPMGQQFSLYYWSQANVRAVSGICTHVSTFSRVALFNLSYHCNLAGLISPDSIPRKLALNRGPAGSALGLTLLEFLQRLSAHDIFQERERGIEPPSPGWKPSVIAVIRLTHETDAGYIASRAYIQRFFYTDSLRL